MTLVIAPDVRFGLYLPDLPAKHGEPRWYQNHRLTEGIYA